MELKAQFGPHYFSKFGIALKNTFMNKFEKDEIQNQQTKLVKLLKIQNFPLA